MSRRVVADYDAVMGAILLAEDHDDSRDILVEILRREVHDVTTAVDGLDALRKLRRGSYDMVLLDLMMPIMNGWELRAAMLRDRRLAEVPVVVLTADSTSSPEHWSLCATGFVPKPISFAQLRVAVRRALELRRDSATMRTGNRTPA